MSEWKSLLSCSAMSRKQPFARPSSERSAFPRRSIESLGKTNARYHLYVVGAVIGNEGYSNCYARSECYNPRHRRQRHVRRPGCAPPARRCLLQPVISVDKSHPIDSMSTAEAGAQGQRIQVGAIVKGWQPYAHVRKPDGDRRTSQKFHFDLHSF